MYLKLPKDVSLADPNGQFRWKGEWQTGQKIDN